LLLTGTVSAGLADLNKKIVDNEQMQKAHAKLSPGMTTSEFGCLEDLLGCMPYLRNVLSQRD
jgi:hypothetical protein